MTNKWSKEFWVDLAERVGSTFVGALLTALTVTGATPVDWSDGQIVWTILGLPTLVSLLKGLAANLADPESGASLIPFPPGPEVHDEGGYYRNDPLSWLVVIIILAAVVFFLTAIL